MRDFHERKAKGETRPAPAMTGGQPMEVALMVEIRELRKRAREAADEAERKELLVKCQRLITQLSVLLETTGRPLAARLPAERLDEE